MAIRIDARELREVLRLTPPRQNILLIGKHGIGKSEIITDFYGSERNMPVTAFFLGQMSDPGDLIGLLHKDERHGRSVFLPPYWWPADDQPVVLFLDELNRARPELLQAVQDLALNRTLAGRRLPEGSIVVSAVNAGEEYQLTDLDPALVSRFNVYEFAPTAEDWLVWAADNGIDPRVVTFIQQHHEHLDGDTIAADEAAVTAGLVKTPDRRAWVKVSRFIEGHQRLEELHIKIVAGMVGSRAALAFKQSLALAVAVTAAQILLEFARYKSKLKGMELQDYAMLNEQILLYINSGHYPEDKEALVRNNLLAYLKTLERAKHNEAIAHFASLIESPRFERAMAMAAQSLEIITFLTDYIEGIVVK